MPLFHFITLIIDVRTGSAPIRTSVRIKPPITGGLIKRPNACFGIRCRADAIMRRQLSPARAFYGARVDIEFALHDVRQQAEEL